MAFNLADVLKNVPNVDTGREQIEYLRLDLIDEDPNNFYQLNGLEELAANIALCKLQQPIRVRQKEDGRYIIVSGHRRRAALEMLAVEDPQKWQEVPCIVERDAVSPSLQQLRLIYANASTRKMTAAETAEEAERVTDLLYKLKEEGYEFPGRMRDHVAEAMSISKSKLARLKVIRENLDKSWVDAWKDGSLTEAQAYELAQMHKFWQAIIKEEWGFSVQSLYADTIKKFRQRFEAVQDISCKHGLAVCEHTASMMRKNVCQEWAAPCTGCCFDCSRLQNCKNCCPEAMAKKKEMKDVAKQANLDAKREQEERDRPGAEFARMVWDRIGKARKKSGCSMEDLYKARGEHAYAAIDVVNQENWENGKGKYGPDSLIGFGHALCTRDLMRVAAVADALNCSLDWLLGRTDDRQSHLSMLVQETPVSDLGTEWKIGDPTENGRYILLVRYDVDALTCLEEWGWYNDNGWQDEFHQLDDDLVEILGWIPSPKLPAVAHSSLNSSCITGISPSGHCGAAACCDNEHTCCLQCGNTSCNSRCGWIDDVAEEI